MISEESNPDCGLPQKMKTSIEDTFLEMSRSPPTETPSHHSPYHSPYHSPLMCAPYTESAHMFNENFINGEPLATESDETTSPICHQQNLTACSSMAEHNTDSTWYSYPVPHSQQQLPLPKFRDEYQQYLSQYLEYSRSTGSLNNSFIDNDVNSFAELSLNNGVNSFNSQSANSSVNSFNSQSSNSSVNSFNSQSANSSVNSFNSQSANSSVNSFNSQSSNSSVKNFNSQSSNSGIISFNSQSPNSGINSFTSQSPNSGVNSFVSQSPNSGINSSESRSPNSGINRFLSQPPNSDVNSSVSRSPNSGINRFFSQPPNSGVNSFFSQCSDNSIDPFTNKCLTWGNSYDNAYKTSDPHFGHNNEMNTELHAPFVPASDINSNNFRFTVDNWCDDQSFPLAYSSGKDNRTVADFAPSEYKNWEMFPDQPLFGLSSIEKDSSDDSGVSRSSSISSCIEEDNFGFSAILHLCHEGDRQRHSETDHHYSQDPNDGSYDQVFDIKTDPYENYFVEHEVFDDMLKPLRCNGSSSSESASYPHYFPNGSITEATSCTPRQSTDMQYVQSRHGSPLSDEGFCDEPFIPEDKLPCFSQIQQPTDSDRDSQSSRSISSAPKEKKKAVREMVPLIEKERRKPGRKPGQVSNVLHLWEFIRDLLHDGNSHGVIEWISKPDGVFQVKNSSEVARLWGEKKKNKKKMTYEKLSRSLRYSRLEGYFADLPKDKNYPKKLCFRFGPKSKNWCDMKGHY